MPVSVSDPQRRIAFEPLECRRQRYRQVLIERVEAVRPVERDARDALLDRKQHKVLLRHGYPPDPAIRIVILPRLI